MDDVWTWLKRANARAVCACCVAALVLVTAYWAWRLWRPAVVSHPPPAPSASAPAPSGFNLMDILAQERAAFTNQRARNPFLLPESLQPRVEPPVPSVTQAEPQTDPTRPTTPPPNVTPPTPPAPRREKVDLRYRGSMRRDDGTLTALIEDSRSRRSAFYPAGTNIVGYRIERIGPEEVEIVRGDQTLTVRRGVATPIEGTPHAD